MKPNPFTKDVDAFEPPAKGGEMSNKPESRKDEIIALMKKHQTHGNYGLVGVNNDKYETVATEIEKLFEGKVEYIVQYVEIKRKFPPQGAWLQLGAMATEKSAKEIYDQEKRNSNPREFKLRYLKRTTTDQIIS